MSRSLAPKEHGAYAQLGLPLATALLAGRPGVAAWSLAIAASALFLAHEPALVLLGRRGARAKKEAGSAARKRIALLLAIALVGVPALPNVVVAAIVPLLLFVVSAAIVARDLERTLLGESVLATCLASAAMPVAVAAQWSFASAAAALFVWSTGMIAATIAVRGVIAAKKRAAPPARTALLVAVAPVLAAFAAAAGYVPWWTAIAPSPIVVVAIAVAARPPHPRALKTIGWALVAATAATGVAIAYGLS